MLHERVVVAGVEDDRDLRDEVREGGDWLDAGIAVLVAFGAVVRIPERVVEVADPVLGSRRVQRGAGAVVIEERGGVQEGLGAGGVGDVIDVEVTVRCIVVSEMCSKPYDAFWGRNSHQGNVKQW